MNEDARNPGAIEEQAHDRTAGREPAPASGKASWLSPGVLLLLGALSASSGEGAMVLAAAGTVGEGWGHWTALAAGASAAPGSQQNAVVVKLSDPGQRWPADRLELSPREGASGPAGEFEVTELRPMLEGIAAVLGPAERQRLLDFIRSSTDFPGGGSMVLGRSLSTARDALTERPPPMVIALERPQGAAVEVLIAVDERCFFIQGWLRDREAPTTRLTAVTPEGERVELLDALFRYSRPDVQELYGDSSVEQTVAKDGFIAYVELQAPSRTAAGWVLEMENEAGTVLGIAAPEAMSDPLMGRRTILASLPFQALPDELLMSTKVHPAIEKLQTRACERATIASIVDYGDVPGAADVSVVIPLFGRIEFMEHQLAQFHKDPAMHSAELIYVLDSPELDKPLRDAASNLHKLYGLPFRVVTMEHTGGFAGATNSGVSAARGRLLLLLNSDVFPIRNGWLDEMRRFYDSKERIGALGAKLLYEDDALQHAGLYFEFVDDTALAGAWANAHYFKGMNRDLPAANRTVPVPAVTGACLMISRELYDELGGLPEIYVQGDHEDSELCLRLIEAGRENWYMGSVELYHLEGQSYDGTFRGMTALYNRWLHSRRWGELIAKVMSDFRRPDVAHRAGAGDGGVEQPVAELPTPR